MFNFDNLYNSFRSAGLLLDGAKPARFLAIIWFPIFNKKRSQQDSGFFGGSFLDVVSNVAKGGTSVIKTARTALTCKAAQLPSTTIQKVDIPIAGNQKVRLAGDRSFDEEMGLTLYNDADFTIRNSIENWISNIQEHESGNTDPRYMNSFPEEYKSTAIVIQLGESKASKEAGALAGIGAGASALSSLSGGAPATGAIGALAGAAGGAVAGKLLGDAGIPMPLYAYKFSGVFPLSVGQIDLNWENSDQIEEFTVNFSYDYFDIDLNPQNFLTNF